MTCLFKLSADIVACYVKKPIAFVLLCACLPTGCKREGSAPPVVEDLSIALQTIKHQVEDLGKSRTEARAVVEAGTRKTEVRSSRLEYSSEGRCLKQGGVFEIVVTGSNGKKELYRAEIIDGEHIKIKGEHVKNSDGIYRIKELCDNSKP